MSKHRIQAIAPSPAGPSPLGQLSALDLQEFQLRIRAVTAAKHNSMMVEESYNRWIKDAIKRYGFDQAEIDPRTGILRLPAAPVKEANA
jgi:hypothetical protein